MSSASGLRDGTVINSTDLTVARKAITAPNYPTPPNSPPQTTLDAPNAPKQSGHESLASAIRSPGLPTPPISPEKGLILNDKAEKPVEAEAEKKLLALKSSLGLENWRCGCPTQQKSPCTRPIAENSKDEVNSQLEAMITLTQSSTELESKLRKLAVRVHCWQHDHGYSLDDRIEAWMEKFPVGSNGTKRAVSVEKQIRKVLGRLSVRCVEIAASTRERCKLRIGGQKVQNCIKTIDEIVKPEVYMDDDYLEDLLEVLETNTFCHRHIIARRLKRVERWKLEIIAIRQKAASELARPIDSGANEESQSPSRPSNTLQGKNLSGEKSSPISQNQRLPTPRTSRSRSADPVTFWPKAYDTTPFDIIARSSNPADRTASYELVRKKVSTPLASDGQAKGYVYLHEVEGNRGLVKIGYTSRSVKERHEEWAFDCNRNPKVLYPKVSGTVVLNAHRVEEICHAELDHRRIRVYCKSCLKQHIEWFEISPEEAIAVIEKWSKWMAADPYEAKLRSRSKFLKEDQSRRIRDINQFMKEISATAVSTAASTLDSGREVSQR